MPAEFVGVWERVELSVNGDIVVGAGRSYWFQGPSRFLDVRAAGAGIRSEAFAGTTDWDEGARVLSWQHDLDLHPGPSDDAGRVEWRDGDLIEHGSADSAVGAIDYAEVWRRRSIDGATMTIAERVGGVGRLAACNGRVAVLIDDRPTGILRAGHAVDRGWATVFDLVLGGPLPRDFDPTLGGRERSFTSFGCQWAARESAAVQSSSPR